MKLMYPMLHPYTVQYSFELVFVMLYV